MSAVWAGVLLALAGTLVASAGHFVARLGNVRKERHVELMGMIMSTAMPAAADCAATALAPRVLVSAIGACVIVWNLLLGAAFEGALPSGGKAAATAVAAAGVALVVVGGPKSADGTEVSPALFAYALASAAWALARDDDPVALGAFGGSVGAFLKVAVSGAVGYWPVVMCVALTHAALLGEMLRSSDVTKTVPKYTAALVVSGIASACVAFGARPDDARVFAFGVGLCAAGLLGAQRL